jgi:hypothetical protein
MGRVDENKIVGQLIIKQSMTLVNKVETIELIQKYETYCYIKSFKTQSHLLAMLFCILSPCDWMIEICQGCLHGGLINFLGVDQAPEMRIVCGSLRNRSHKFFEDLYFTLVNHCQSFLSDSRTFGLTYKEVLSMNQQLSGYSITY